MTQKEIADKLRVPLTTVQWDERQALKKLKKSPTMFLAWMSSIERSGERRSLNVGTMIVDEMPKVESYEGTYRGRRI